VEKDLAYPKTYWIWAMKVTSSKFD